MADKKTETEIVTLTDEQHKAIVDDVTKAVTDGIDDKVASAVKEAMKGVTPRAASASDNSEKSAKYTVKNTGKAASGFYDADGIEYSLEGGKSDKDVSLTEAQVGMLEKTGFKVSKGK